jgi:hypothetical protein
MVDSTPTDGTKNSEAPRADQQCPNRPSVSRGWGCRFYRIKWFLKNVLVVLVSVGSHLFPMLHIIVIVAFVGIGAVCHLIGEHYLPGVTGRNG